MALEIYPRDAVLEWANEVVAAHPDHKVIAVTHSHLDADGSYQAETGGYNYYPINYPEDSNDAQAVWDEFVSLHENMFLFISGHNSSNEIVNVAKEGVNGNTVYQLLIDQQDVDKNEKGVGNIVVIGVDEENSRLGYPEALTLSSKSMLMLSLNSCGISSFSSVKRT